MIERIITSSVLIIAIWLISILAEKRVNPCIKYALWLLVAMKLLIPMPEFESTVSVMNATNKIAERNVRYFFADDEAAGADKSIQGKAVSDEARGYGQYAETGNITGQTTKNSDFSDICLWIWSAGALICASVFLWSNLRFYRQLKNDRVKIGRVKGKLNIYQVSDMKSPCLFGVLKPSIYFQKGSHLSEDQRKLVLAHEYTHYKHGDHIWALVRCVCIILYWYHPLVWGAAYKSIKDGELACDAGTLKIIGDGKRIEYGRTLIEIARETQNTSAGIRVLGCSTSAAGGVQEMKKRMRMIVDRPRTKIATLLVILIICTGIVGCTFGNAVSEENIPGESVSLNEGSVIGKYGIVNKDQEDGSGGVQQPEQETAALGIDDMMYEEVALYNQPKADKVCIRLEPSVLRDYAWYYYIPEGRDQEWLRSFMDDLSAKGIPHTGSMEGMKETGWQIVYKDQRFMVFEGGYLYGDREAMEGYMLEVPKLCDYIQIMLQEQLDYNKFDPADIKDITSAKLDVCSIFTNNEYYSQTITDEETLKMFEDWFCNAEYILGGAACGNEDACLELILADGERVRLSIAIDSCSNFGINGVYYDYRPKPVWNNREFFACFNEIPFEF